LIVNSTRNLILTNPTGDFSIDGIDGTGTGDRNGNITVNGNLTIADKLFASTNNTPAKSCNLTVGATGKLTVANIDANVDGTAGTLGAFSFTINAGGKINLTGKLKVLSGNLNSNGGLVIKSTATQTALIDGSGAGNVTGDVLVERKIGTLSGYHFLSSPVSGAFVNNTVSGWRDDFTILSSVDGLLFLPGGTYSVLPTVFEYDETNLNPNASYGYIGATGTTDPITPLKGFACVVPGNTTVDVFGQVNNGPINYNVTKASDGLNLIGNPYPSPINWTSFRSHNTNLSTIYKSFVTTGGYNGSYGEYNIATSLGTNGVGNIIASSQGFIVEANTAGAIQAINTDRTTDLNPTFFSQPAVVNDVLRLELVKDNRQDEILIFFAPSMSTDNFDALTDAKKLLPFNTDHSFVYSIAGNDKLAMNGLGEFNMDKVIPLGIKVSTAGLHQIVATDLSSFAPSAMVYLYDAETGTVQNLRSNPSYSANLTAGTHEGRFFIQFTPAVQLAVTAATCAGNGNDGKVNLTYNSVSLINVSVKNETGVIIATINNFNGQQTINNLLPGNYEIIFTHANGFTSVDYFTISNVTAVNLQVNLSTSNSTIGENINFNAVSSSSTTNWNFGDGVAATGNDVNHIYNLAGNYIVTATASNGECEKTIEIPVSVTSATGIENMNNQTTTWLIANNQITIKFSEGIAENTSIELFDLAGKLIYSNTISKGQMQHNIPTAKFAEGIYVAKLNLNNSNIVKKVALRK
jgi:PKD repeat protein